MDRQQRLTELLQYITNNGNYEYSFDNLYQKLLSEFNTEFKHNSNMQENLYLNNLRQTRDKQAADYIRTKKRRPKSGSPREFREFVNHFTQDINEGLRLHIKPQFD